MCRNIKPLFHFDPPATPEEIRAASLQYVRKLSGMNKPSGMNKNVFEKGVEEIAQATARLLTALESNTVPKSREAEREKARIRNIKRFGDVKNL
jgi:hypothetical protein